jgi:hypothetical protein
VCTDGPLVNTCGATQASGALALTDNYLPQNVVGVGMGGYAFAYSDSDNGNGGMSSICLRTDALCAKGTVGSNAASSSKDYGAGVGFTLNQPNAMGCMATTAAGFTPSGLGIEYKLNVTTAPPNGFRVAIDSGGTDYCATAHGNVGYIPWASFNTKCWDLSGTSLGNSPPSGSIHVEFQLPASSTAGPFDFCVDSVSFPTTAPNIDAGTTGTACSGNSCCTPSPNPVNSGGGELTCYTFAQAGSPPTSPGVYKSYCGYVVDESSGGGNNNGICESGQLNYTDKVANNIGTNPEYFVAFPTGNSGWGQGAYCGMCVNISYGGKTLMATVVDECPTGSCTSNGGHLDLNGALARDLGLGVGGATGDATSGVTWTPVECPVTGNIQAVFNSLGGGQVYFQNVVWPIKSITNGSCGTGGCKQQNGIWGYNAPSITSGTTVVLTDILGHTVTAQIVPGDIGVQFPNKCN